MCCLVHYMSIFAFQKKIYIYMRERDIVVMDECFFFNKRPTMMCLGEKKDTKKDSLFSCRFDSNE